MTDTMRHKIPLLAAKFRFAGEKVLCGYARFYGDRIELDGWRLTGRVHRIIPLAAIVGLEYHPLDADGNLNLVLEDGSTLNLVVEDAHRWLLAYESWLNYHVLASAKVLQEEDLVAAMAG